LLVGIAYFDDFVDNFDPKVIHSCYAAFLETGHALLLKKTDPKALKFEHVGVAKFLWADSQASECPLNKAINGTATAKLVHESLSNGVCQHGPITNQDERVTVAIY
jgi:hypothetical protein